jgi:hypothetical protein
LNTVTKRGLTLAVSALAALGLVACKSASAATTSSRSPGVIANNAPGSGSATADVTLGSLDNTSDAYTTSYTASLTITNHTSKTSNYMVTVAFESADHSVQYDTATAFADNLQPGQTTTTTAESFKAIPASAVVHVAEVTRYAS